MDDKRRYYKYMYAKRADGKEPTAAERTAAWAEYEKRESKITKALGNRNYTLFGVLAGVRNRDVRPLFAGRGMPDDCSNTTKEAIPEDSDYHSHTFFTLKDLMEVDPEAVAESNGSVVLYADQFRVWKETGKVPEDVEEYAWDRSEETREISEEEMTMLLLSNDVEHLAKTRTIGGQKQRYEPHVRIGTPRTYKQLVPDLFDIIPDLRKHGEPDKVRVVIAFDN